MSYLPPANSYVAAASQNSHAGPPPQTGSAGVAIAGLIIGIIAFVTGWIPIFGFILGGIGIVLGIIAVRASLRRGFGIAALVLSGLAVVTNIFIIIALVVTVPGAVTTAAHDAQVRADETNARTQAEQDAQNTKDAEPGPEEVSGHSIITPCYSVQGPAAFINNQSSASTQDCVTTLELWGEVSPDGTIVNTGVGTILGQVSVEPIRLATSETWAATGNLDGVVDYIAVDYLPQMGEVISLREPVMLEDSAANISRVDSNAVLTKTKAIIVGFAPHSYDTSQGPVQLFVISIVTPYDNGDELIDAVVDSWEWK